VTPHLQASPRRPSLPVRALRYAGRRALEAALFVRGGLIQAAYTAHYREARRAYPAPAAPLGDVGVHVIRPGEVAPAIPLPPDFNALVATVARSASAALDSAAACDFYPEVAAERMPVRSADVEEVKGGQVLTIKLRDPFAIDGLSELCDPLLAALERQVYGSYTIVDKVYAYRSPVSHQVASESWLWHYDNHPREVLKVMIYLTDVTEGSAPFEYLRTRATGRSLYGSPLAPLFGDSRIPASTVEGWLARECERHAVTGPRGTVLMFDDNVVHRATAATTAHRDVIVFQVRPVPFAVTSHLHRRWTGTFKHRDIQRNPWELFPKLRAAAKRPL
jgi:hypothetical protein